MTPTPRRSGPRAGHTKPATCLHSRRWRPLVHALSIAALASVCRRMSGARILSSQAGRTLVRVVVRLPGVIPGLAEISVRVGDAKTAGVSSVTAQAIQWNLGPEGAPPPDVAKPVPGDPELFATNLWFMTASSYRVNVTVDGSKGSGSAMVPVLSIATEQRRLSPALSWLLAGLGTFLFVGALTIVGAAVRESVVAPGSRLIDPGAVEGGWLSEYGGGTRLRALGWMEVVGVEAAAYRELVLYRPLAMDVAIDQHTQPGVLRLRSTTRGGTRNVKSAVSGLYSGSRQADGFIPRSRAGSGHIGPPAPQVRRNQVFRSGPASQPCARHVPRLRRHRSRERVCRNDGWPHDDRAPEGQRGAAGRRRSRPR